MNKIGKFIRLAAMSGIIALIPGNAAARITLPGMIDEKMVIQRDAPVKIWGRSDPGEKVSVRFRGKIYSTEGGADGKWQVTLDPQTPGGPFLMEINEIALRDILVGDLWLMSGQSNQELPIARLTDRYPEINVSDNNKIRHFKVPKWTTPFPQEDIREGGRWRSGVASEVLDWTSLAYFLAKKAYEETGVPQGMIVSCLGGSTIETWIEPEALAGLQPQQISTAELVEAASDKGNPDYKQAGFDDAGWKDADVPGFWKDSGIDHKGILWYRKRFLFPDSLSGRQARIDLGTLVDSDSVFVNGRFVGSTSYQYPPRKYTIPAGVLRGGENVVTVKLDCAQGNGGFTPDKDYRIICDGYVTDLKGKWKVAEGRKAGAAEALARAYGNQMEARGGLFNSMLLPLSNCVFKGVVWYQGESNAGRPEEYAALLRGMIQNWRDTFDDPALPFIIVQLPNFMESCPNPSDGGWPRLREAQMEVAQTVSGAYLTVNYDLGEWNDIHPLNKKDVADRIWRCASENIYGRNVEGHAPRFESMRIKDGKAILTFSHVGRGLKTRGGAPCHFAIAGEDRKFVWADAVVKGNKVIVSSPLVANPVAVRYAWANNPEGANLVSSGGMPAAPFRTDAW